MYYGFVISGSLSKKPLSCFIHPRAAVSLKDWEAKTRKDINTVPCGLSETLEAFIDLDFSLRSSITNED